MLDATAKTIILRNFRLIDSSSKELNGKLVNIRVWNDLNPYNLLLESSLNIEDVQASADYFSREKNTPDHLVLDGEGKLCVSQGWAALGVGLTDPGYEWRDDLRSLAESATQGGFTQLVCWPNAKPVIDDSTSLTSLWQRTRDLLPRFDFIAALTVGAEGKDMAELLDLHAAGAAAFSDGTRPLQDPGQLLRSFEYLRPTGMRLIQTPLHQQLALDGVANESETTVYLGLRQQPALAEEFMVAQCLQVLAYTGGKLHFSPVTTAGALQLIRSAKAQGLDVTADTAPQYLFFDDAALSGFETVFKVQPPLRTRADVEALREALADGTLDCVSAQHFPQAPEDKELEFDHAEFGMLTLECAFAALHHALVVPGQLTLERLIELLTVGPRRVLSPFPENSFATNTLTIFDPDEEWTVGLNDLRSRSRNCPWLGQTLKGRPVGAVVGDRVWWRGGEV